MTRGLLKIREGVAKMVVFEHRSGAYNKYVSTGAQKSAICSPASRISNRPLRTAALGLSVLMLTSLAAIAQNASDRVTGMKLSNDLPIQIESDRLDVREADSIAEFTGNVSVVQDKTLLKAGKLIVYYAKTGGSAATGSAAIDRLEVSGKVYVKSATQVATGDSGTFDMKSQVLVLSGNKVVLSEGKNVAAGCKLTVQMQSGRAKLESCKAGGRVSIVLDPKNK